MCALTSWILLHLLRFFESLQQRLRSLPALFLLYLVFLQPPLSLVFFWIWNGKIINEIFWSHSFSSFCGFAVNIIAELSDLSVLTVGIVLVVLAVSAKRASNICSKESTLGFLSENNYLLIFLVLFYHQSYQIWSIVVRVHDTFPKWSAVHQSNATRLVFPFPSPANSPLTLPKTLVVYNLLFTRSSSPFLVFLSLVLQIGCWCASRDWYRKR